MKFNPAAGLAMALALALAGCGSSSDGSDAQPVALVSLSPASNGSVGETATVYGTVEPGSGGRRTLAAPIEAMMVSVEAPVGTAVRAGQIIAHLSPSPASRLEIGKAGSDAAAADAAYARAQRLRADGLASNADVETARAAAQAADMTRGSLGARSASLALRAPVSGYVESLAFAPGDIVAAGTTVAAVSGSGAMRARFGIDPALAGRVMPGSSLVIRLSNGTTIGAAVESVDPVVDPTTRLAAIFATLPAGTAQGANASLSAQLTVAGAQQSSVSIPYVALLDDAGQPYVFVVANNVAHRRDVTLGPVSGDRVVIAKGVRAGDQVVTSGGTAIEDGMKVRTK